ncbi:ATP-binding cassette domain-containing protein [Caldichromatium japonicum]|uniref:ATP-binding cassette domain-containing protein n=1 Tax=Caldichromatium japonicum TaxID=2699430 RepID=UPI0031B60BDC
MRDLRAIAGLECVPDGRLLFDGEVWQEGKTFVPTYRRPLGYVFQEASPFPHLSVRENLDYGMKRRGANGAGFAETIELLGIGHLLDRRPERLSGGER